MYAHCLLRSALDAACMPGTNTKGWRFSISNRADDVYFGLKGLVKGLRKSTRLRIVFEVHIMSNAGEQ